MKFLDLVKSRQSVRRYRNQKVEPEKIERCIEAARLAPSACNSQPWSFVVVTDPELCKKVATATFNELISFNKFVIQAPVLIVIVQESPKLITRIGGEIKRKEYPLIDIGIAAEHLCLQAVEEGLGTCMIGWFNQTRIRKLLGIPTGKSIGLILTLGYPPETYRVRDKSRKSYNDTVFYNTYGASRL